jgi:hypothetical protein
MAREERDHPFTTTQFEFSCTYQAYVWYDPLAFLQIYHLIHAQDLLNIVRPCEGILHAVDEECMGLEFLTSNRRFSYHPRAVSIQYACMNQRELHTTNL